MVSAGLIIGVVIALVGVYVVVSTGIMTFSSDRRNERASLTSEISSASSDSGTPQEQVPNSSEGRRSLLSSFSEASSSFRGAISSATDSIGKGLRSEEERVSEIEKTMQKLKEEEAGIEEAIDRLEEKHPDSEVASQLEKLREAIESEGRIEKEVLEEIEEVLQDEQIELKHLLQIEEVEEEVDEELRREFSELEDVESRVEENKAEADGVVKHVNRILESVFSGNAEPEEAVEQLEEAKSEAEQARDEAEKDGQELGRIKKSLKSVWQKINILENKEEGLEEENQEVEGEISEEKSRIGKAKSDLKQVIGLYKQEIKEILNPSDEQEAEEVEGSFQFYEWLGDKERKTAEEEGKTQEEVEKVEKELEQEMERELKAAEALREESWGQNEVLVENEKEMLWQELRIDLIEYLILGREGTTFTESVLEKARRNGYIKQDAKQELMEEVRGLVAEFPKFSKLAYNEETRALNRVEAVIYDFEYSIPRERKDNYQTALKKLRGRVESLRSAVEEENDDEDRVGYVPGKDPSPDGGVGNKTDEFTFESLE